MKKILFSLLVVGLSLGFASCSSSDSDDDNTPPYLNIENESITIPYKSNKTIIKIKTNENWEVDYDANWLSIDGYSSGKGDADIRLYNQSNESSKERRATITIKTPSFNKPITIIQKGDNRLKSDPFIFKRSSLYVKNYDVGGGYNSGYVGPYGGTSGSEVHYSRHVGNKPKFSIALRMQHTEWPYRLTPWMYIFLNEHKEVLTEEEVADLFLQPYYIAFVSDSFTYDPQKPNVTKENLITSRSGNRITYQFNNFQPRPGSSRSLTLDGKMVFELIDFE